jgi:branched-chain amino acid transport system ATP-binding protein
MLLVENLEAYYGSSQALFGMALKVETGQVVTLLGRNGMGKTTTINSIMGIVANRTGRIEFDGRDVLNLASFRIAQSGLGLVPEGRQVFPNLTVQENLIATAGNRTGHPDPWTMDKIYDMFPALKERRGSMGNLLSGGEQQMLAIGRALMTNPALLILDEATEGLAPLVRQEIWACLGRLKAEKQSILVVDKNIADLMRIADHNYIIEKGKVVWEGSSAALARNKKVQEKSLGV